MFSRFRPDNFIIALVATVVVATLAPAQGWFAEICRLATTLAIGLLFFLHGARISRRMALEGLGHWRLHAVVFASTFILFPLLGLAAHLLVPSLLTPALYAGVLFLCLLPSTVQSSIAFTSIAGGNVPAAICSASASNIIGMFLTPALVALFFSANGNGFSMRALEGILAQLLLPFILGQLLQPWLGAWLGRHRNLTGLVDRGSVLMVVYLAFGEAVIGGLWHTLSPASLLLLAGVDIVLLAAVLCITTYASRYLGFSRRDEITIVFCGSKKSLASGVPMANVIFAGQDVGSIVLPLMLFHQIQLMACAALARRYAQRAPHQTQPPTPGNIAQRLETKAAPRREAVHH
ncbi:solute carrier family 10 (sodium/bile acid cotransporter), member 7 [Rhizobiales bacterium GAS188]|nr:solute carrier family 10 (sodium/bile acid cotransporter), member 7 [Rhizobiales bacterium GAS188]